MKKLAFRIIGAMILLCAIFGILFSLAGISATWLGKSAVQSRLIKDLAMLDRTLSSTADLLQTIDESLEKLEEGRSMLESSIQLLSDAIDEINPMVTSLSDLIGKDYYDIVTSTQSSLKSLQASAQMVDNTLSLVSRLPFIGGSYAPDEPIHTTIGNMIQALETVPPKLTEIGTSLEESTTDLQNLSSELDQFSENLSQLDVNISQARQTIKDYQVILDEAKNEVEDITENIASWLNLVAMAVSLFFFWMLVVQVAVFTQGMEIYNQRDRFYKHPLDPT